MLQSFDPNTSQWTTEKVTYYVSSSVLGGAVISEVSAQGAKERSFVLADGKALAIQSVEAGVQGVSWEHYDASSASYRPTNATGSPGLGAEMDPMGANAGQFKPITWPPPTSSGKLEPYYGVPELNSATQGCVLDRVPIPCDIFNSLPNNDAIQQEYLLPDVQEGPPTWRKSGEKRAPPEIALKVFTVDIVSHGIGLFSVTAPSLKLNNEGSGWNWSEQVLFAHPQNPVPQPPPTPTPTPPDPCNSPETWNIRLGDFRQLGKPIGFNFADNGTPKDKRGFSFTKVVKRLNDSGFSSFINLNFIDHPGGFDYEGKINRRWYHVTIYPTTQRQSTTNPRQDPKFNLPVRKLEIHCESNYARPQTHLFP